jgi:transglutaminase-like putative cysteine protease
VRLRAVAAVACLAVATAGSWTALIAAPTVRFAGVVALAVMPAVLVVSGLSRRAAAAVGVLCVPGVLLVAGAPVSTLAPGAWPQSVARLASGAAQFAGPVRGSTPSPWALAVVMLASGAAWMAGAMLAPRVGDPTGRLVVAFVVLAAPWLVGVGESRPDHAAWQGAVAVLAGVLWFSSTPIVIPLGVLAAVSSVVIAQSIAPRTRWFGPHEQEAQSSPFTTLETEPTYGPLTGRRTGAPMLVITAAKPAFWRMQTLDYFDGSGWTIAPDPLPELPEPLSRRQEIAVRVIGLHQDLVVAPGRVDRVSARGSVGRAAGEAWRVEPPPRPGETYRVVASAVSVDAARLAADRAPLARRAYAYTQVGPAATGLTAAQLIDWVAGSLGLGTREPSRAARVRTTTTRAHTRLGVDARIVALARRLVAGTRTEWDKVVRVERYLLYGGRFRYTTHVPPPGPQPLVDFLIRTRAGYCEQFAAAAALLLRIVGVPARVVAGFATGTQTRADQYVVRDVDAHDWIEVYFPAVGWVTFNPTPAASPATIAAGLDPLRLSTASAGTEAPALPAVLCVLAVATGLALLRRRRHRSSYGPLEQLERVARRSGGRLEPATTLAQLEEEMARIGPHVAALVAEAERERFAPGPAAGSRHPRIRMARALASDLGPLRALLVCAPVPGRIRLWSGVVSPTPEERDDEQRQQEHDRRQRQKPRQLS